ncbi:hypothetical protein BGZ65_010826, partial [Modicella reniformis]
GDDIDGNGFETKAEDEMRSHFGEGGWRSYNTRCASLILSEFLRSENVGGTAVLCCCVESMCPLLHLASSDGGVLGLNNGSSCLLLCATLADNLGDEDNDDEECCCRKSTLVQLGTEKGRGLDFWDENVLSVRNSDPANDPPTQVSDDEDGAVLKLFRR